MKSIKLYTKYINSHAVSIFLAIFNYLPLTSHQSHKARLSNDVSRTLSFFRFLFIGILFCISSHSFAQKLVLKNSVSEQTYKIGYLRHVWISNFQDSTKTFFAYVKKTENDTLYFIGGKKIALTDIYSIKFTPRNLFTRVGKPILYSLGTGISILVGATLTVSDYSFTVSDRFKMIGGGIIYSTVLIELTGTGLWIITPKRELQKGINLTILNK
jgi:hypothetical protein